MAEVCSLNSLSVANPSLPARLLTATTGKTTLIAVLETPRSLVLAWETGVPWDVVASLGSAAPAVPPPLPDGARTNHATKPTTMTTMISTVRSCMIAGRLRRRRHERPTGANGFHETRRTDIFRLPSIVTLLRSRPNFPRLRRRGPMPGEPRRSHQGTRPTPSGQRGPDRADPPQPPGPAPSRSRSSTVRTRGGRRVRRGLSWG